MIAKITTEHTAKLAYVYLRQSTMGQVRHHQESTQRQYALREKAAQMGWPPSRIKVLDRDLGLSGTQMNQREDFKLLVADVSMQRVGAVLALEASRLSRSCADWHRLLELCALTGTLIIDEDGIYDPAQFNDQLLLGLKATMSQAELHFLHARLQGGKSNKAKKGELRFPLPVGFSYDEDGRTVLDPDEGVRGTIALFFKCFGESGSAYEVVHRFASRDIRFPKRAYGGLWSGKLIWGQLTYGRALGLLKNPSYAGHYVYGRYGHKTHILEGGRIEKKITRKPMAQWDVLIPDHHPGFIGWDQYLRNQDILASNRTNGEEHVLSGPAREGLAQLQGLLLCARCGHRLTVRYKGNGGIYPVYECNGQRKDGPSTASCVRIRCDVVDRSVEHRVLQVLEPAQFEIAIQAVEELRKRDQDMTRQWQMQIQRADYEAQLAQRRYEEVDPSNRLVTATLEHRWNEALERVDQVKQQYADFRQRDALSLTPEQKQQALALAKDLPRLWQAPSTQAKDRKRILRLLIKDITVEKVAPKRILLHLRWQGGSCEDLAVELPPNIADRLRYPTPIVEKVRQLAESGTDTQIAATLNQEGMLSAKGKPFTVSIIKWLRYKHGIPTPELKRKDELTVQDIARRFRVNAGVVYYWIAHGVLTARRMNRGSPCWITLDTGKEAELSEWVAGSNRIQRK
jgi:DNA invertase Pin-like site-specific DNA recombinase